MDRIPRIGFLGRCLRRSMLATGVILCSFSSMAMADDRQYKVEAAFLYSFFNYITWPNHETPQALDKAAICLYEGDPLLPYLEYIAHKMSSERKLTVRSVTDGGDTAGCHIFFMRHRLSTRMMAAVSPSTLTVFKPDDPLDRGGMVELSEDGERIAIKIDQSQLEQNGFRISSRLLNLAQLVK